MAPVEDIIARGISLSLGGRPAASLTKGEVDGPRRRPDGLLEPAPWEFKPEGRKGGDGKMLAGGGGLMAAFKNPAAEDSMYTTQDGQKNYEANAQEQALATYSEMCFVCDWFPEPWPLETRDRTSTCGYINRLPLKADLDVPKSGPRENVLVFGDVSGTCKQVLDKASQGLVGKVEYVQTPLYDLDAAEIKELLQKEKWDLVLYGAGADLPASNATDDVLAFLDDVTRVYLELLKAVQTSRKTVKRVACLTREVFSESQQNHRKVGVRMVTSSTLWGMGNCARVEFEDTPLHYIDMDLRPSEHTLRKVASELLCAETFGHNSVRFADGERYVMRQMRAKEYDGGKPEFTVPAGGVIAITGGNGSLAQVFTGQLMDLADRRNRENPHLPKAHFEVKLLSRSAVVRPREMPAWQEVVRKAEKVGIHVEHVKCDVTNIASVERFVADCTPNLTGIIHTAGVLQDAMLQGQTWEKMQTCLGCKSRAALYLHQALEQYPNPDLEFFWAFSTNSVYGNAGQVNYAGANCYLDGLMRHRTAVGKPGVAMQWGAWGEAGMAAAMNDQMKQGIAMSHMPFFSNAEGFAGMYTGIGSGIPSICIEKFNPQLLLGMKSQADTLAQRFDRNFTCQFAPTPPPNASKPLKTQEVYDLFRMYHSLAGPSQDALMESGLSYQAHTAPLKRKNEEEENEQLW